MDTYEVYTSDGSKPICKIKLDGSDFPFNIKKKPLLKTTYVQLVASFTDGTSSTEVVKENPKQKQSEFQIIKALIYEGVISADSGMDASVSFKPDCIKVGVCRPNTEFVLYKNRKNEEDDFEAYKTPAALYWNTFTSMPTHFSIPSDSNED